MLTAWTNAGRMPADRADRADRLATQDAHDRSAPREVIRPAVDLTTTPEARDAWYRSLIYVATGRTA